VTNGTSPAAKEKTAVMRRRSSRAVGAVILTALATAAALFGGARASAATGEVTGRQPTATTAATVAHPVIFVDIDGLQASDVTPATMPNLFNLAQHGALATMSIRTVFASTCPTDGWFTLGTGARSAHPRDSLDGGTVCAVPPAPTPGPHGSATVPGYATLAQGNLAYHYSPVYGALANALAADGDCLTAVGPGAALAAADQNGHVASYLDDAAQVTPARLAACQMTLVDLGGFTTLVPPHDATWVGGAAAGATARAAAMHAADARLGTLLREAPQGSLIAVAGLSDTNWQSHLHPLIVSGTAANGEVFDGGWLTTPSTRHTGLANLTDLTPSLLRWAGVPASDIAKKLIGSQIGSTDQGRPASTTTALRSLQQQDIAARVFANTNGTFLIVMVLVSLGLLVFGCGVFVLRRLVGPSRARPALATLRLAGLVLGSVPVASFLTNLAQWWRYQHPARVLFGVTAALAIVIGLIANFGPWRRHPLGRAGVIAATTVAVVGLDVMSGSRLQMASPYGLSTLIAGRFYGVGNSALGPYIGAAMIGTTWLASLALPRAVAPAAAERSRRRRALLIVVLAALFTVVASGLPSFGNKFGGTIAMVPGFAALGIIVYGARVTWRKVLAILGSGVVVVAAFTVFNLLQPASQRSDFGSFLQSIVTGGALDTLQRKITTNIASLHNDWISPYLPYVVLVLGILVIAPRLVRSRTLSDAYQRVPMLRIGLITVLLTEVLGWFVDDSGLLVPKVGITLVVPLALATIVDALAAPPTPVKLPAQTERDSVPTVS
jgi:hypothetical protein